MLQDEFKQKLKTKIMIMMLKSLNISDDVKEEKKEKVENVAEE